MADAPKPKVLNARQEAFSQSYARAANATQAAKDAGYTTKTAHAQGHRLLSYAEIGARIETIRIDRFRSMHMTADEVLMLSANQARASMGEVLHVTPDGDPYIDLSKASPEFLANIAEVIIEDFTDGRDVDDEGNTIKRDVRRVKVKLLSQDSARTTLMKHLGLLKERVEISVDDSFATKMEEAQRRAREARKIED